jgi:predicted esterase YcpF (UPF0227 family)
MHGDRFVVRCSLLIAGRHNRWNAIAAVVAAEHAGVPPADAIAALAAFRGVRRRLEVRGTVAGVTVIDDFAHHPSAIETTVAGLRARLAPGQRILAVIEPRSNTMKLGSMKALLPTSLEGAERTYCHAAGLDWDAAEALAPLGERAWVGKDLDRLVERVVADAREGDQVLVMSNGGFGGVHGRLLQALGSLTARDGSGRAPLAAAPAAPAVSTAQRDPRGRLIYLHGFRSSPQSFKARMLAERMAALGLAERFACPMLPPSPREAIAFIESDIAPTREDVLVGSSLGGYYARLLAERHGCRAVLINPAVRPDRDLRRHLGTQSMYHDPTQQFEVLPEFLDELRALRVEGLSDASRYLLVAATGDELIDWRDMVADYPGATHRIVEGSDHGLSDFDRHIAAVLAFAGFEAAPGAGPGP